MAEPAAAAHPSAKSGGSGTNDDASDWARYAVADRVWAVDKCRRRAPAAGLAQLRRRTTGGHALSPANQITTATVVDDLIPSGPIHTGDTEKRDGQDEHAEQRHDDSRRGTALLCPPSNAQVMRSIPAQRGNELWRSDPEKIRPKADASGRPNSPAAGVRRGRERQ